MLQYHSQEDSVLNIRAGMWKSTSLFKQIIKIFGSVWDILDRLYRYHEICNNTYVLHLFFIIY